MLYEYAIDPSVLSDIHNCQTIFDNFKPENGKVIADVPRKWGQEAFQAITGIPHEKCGPVMKKTLKEKLRKLADEGVCGSRPDPNWDRSKEQWLQLAARVNGLYPFSALLTAHGSMSPVQTYAIPQLVINSPEYWDAPTQCDLPRRAKEIVEVLMPLFRLSKTIVLIDMHLYPGDPRSRRVLAELINRVHEFNYGSGVKKILVHSSDRRKDLQQSLNQFIAPHLPAGLEIEYRLWPDSTIHDRFAVTEVGGIFLGHGFDEARQHDDTEEVFASLIGYKKRRSLLAKFSGQPTYIASIRTP